MNKDKIELLLTLGEADYSTEGDWLDYQSFGFEQTDIPELIEFVVDEQYYLAEDASMWTPVHAWRILGQLNAEAAVQPLISLLDMLAEQEEDFSLVDLPIVLGMIGQAAILPLASFINDKAHQEFARITALESLSKIAQKQPNLRDEVLKKYQHYMTAPDVDKQLLNSLLVSFLLDIQATELIEEIRTLFEQDCIDLSVVGDIEDVEIELGLRDERTTPKLSFAEIQGFSDEDMEDMTPEKIMALLDKPPSKPDDENDLIAMLDYYFDLHGNDESILDVSELDGFCASLACSPKVIMPSTWLTAIWGGEALMPEWASIEEVQAFNERLFTVYNHVITSFNDDDYEALFQIRELEDRTVTIVDEWCNGFLRGVNLWGPLAATDAIVLEKELESIRLFATERGFEQLDQMNEDEVEQQRQRIVPATNTLFKHFLKQRTAPVTRAEPKAGRNDPCSCGSGKKYKKCCLH